MNITSYNIYQTNFFIHLIKLKVTLAFFDLKTTFQNLINSKVQVCITRCSSLAHSFFLKFEVLFRFYMGKYQVVTNHRYFSLGIGGGGGGGGRAILISMTFLCELECR